MLVGLSVVENTHYLEFLLSLFPCCDRNQRVPFPDIFRKVAWFLVSKKKIHTQILNDIHVSIKTNLFSSSVSVQRKKDATIWRTHSGLHILFQEASYLGRGDHDLEPGATS